VYKKVLEVNHTSHNRRIETMQSAHSHASVLKLPYLGELERHIENTLSDHWILRVEHADDVNPVHIQWQQ